MRAGTRVKEGDEILASVPFVFTLSPEKKGGCCDYCFKSGSVRRCSCCTRDYYCSVSCQKADWHLFHKYECPMLRRLTTSQVCNETPRLLSKMIIRIKKFEEISEAIDDNYSRKFCDLMNHRDKVLSSNSRVQEFNLLLSFLNKYLTPEFRPVTYDQLLDLYGAMSINSFSITDPELRALGVGLYLSASLFDHSCRPNATAVFEGTTLVVRAVEDMPDFRWEQVRINYTSVLMPRSYRRRQLLSKYFFDCCCRRCEEDVSLEHSISCGNPNCGCPVPVPFVEEDFVNNSATSTTNSDNFTTNSYNSTTISDNSMTDSGNSTNNSDNSLTNSSADALGNSVDACGYTSVDHSSKSCSSALSGTAMLPNNASPLHKSIISNDGSHVLSNKLISPYQGCISPSNNPSLPSINSVLPSNGSNPQSKDSICKESISSSYAILPSNDADSQAKDSICNESNSASHASKCLVRGARLSCPECGYRGFPANITELYAKLVAICRKTLIDQEGNDLLCSFNECEKIVKFQENFVSSRSFKPPSEGDGWDSALHPLNIWRVKALDAAMEVSIEEERYREALKYGKPNTEGMRHYYGKNHATYGFYVAKLGKMSHYLGKTDDALAYLLLAHDSLSTSHGANNSVVTGSIAPMLDQARMEKMMADCGPR